MIQFVVGIIVGIFLATAGVSGLVKVFDMGVEAVKTESRRIVK